MLYSNTIFSLLVQRKDTKEKTPCHLFRYRGISYAALIKRATSESRFTPPSRLSVLCCAARLREMVNTQTTLLYILIQN